MHRHSLSFPSIGYRRLRGKKDIGGISSMASPEKMFKMMLDEIHEGTAPLKTVVQNQEIIIVQNKKIIELLEKLRISSVESSS